VQLNIVSLTKRLRLKLLEQKPNIPIYLCITIYTVVSSYVSILKHNAFLSAAWDLGIFEQALWSTINSSRLFWYSIELPINPGGCFFGVHFSPILFFVLAVYGAFQVTETLLVLQSFILALGALPLYWIARDEINRRVAFIFAGVYLLYPPLHGVNLFDFHPQAFLPVFFLFAFHYFKKEKWTRYFLFVILALMVIEFVPLIVIFLGLYGLWVSRKELAKIVKLGIRKTFTNKKILVSIITIILGICWFIVAMKVIFYFNPSPRPHPNWQRFGDPVRDPLGVLLTVLSNPLYTIEVALTPPSEKLMYIIGLFAPVAFLSFLDLSSLMIGAPWFVASFLSNYPPYYVAVGYQYVAFVIPFIFISALYGTKRLATVIKVISANVGKKTVDVRIAENITVVMLIISILCIATIGANLQVPQVTLRDEALEKMIELIPSDVSVLTQNDIFPHVSRRTYAYVGSNPVGNYSDVCFDYIIVDRRSFWYKLGGDYKYLDLEEFISKAAKSEEYGVLSAIDDMWLLKRGYKGESTFPVKYGILAKFYNQGVAAPIFTSVFLDTRWDWRERLPFPTVNNNSFTVFFGGYLKTSDVGNYMFEVSPLNGSKLYVDGKLILDGWNQNFYNDTTTVFLDKGFHKIEIEYAKSESNVNVNVNWKPPWKETFETIPTTYLYLNAPQGE